jgi:CRP-like cAMP-binding protein
LSTPLALLPFLQKLKAHSALSPTDEDALLALPHEIAAFAPGDRIFGEGERSGHCAIMLSGFACRHKSLANGKRQIVAVHQRGDGVDLQNALMVLVDSSIQALTHAEVALVPTDAVNQLIASSAALARALWIETLIDGSIQREWTLNVGRRDARGRLAHLLCEIGVRQEGAGLARRDHYALPLTQEQLADATGLTPVHVNRVLQSFAGEGLIIRDKGSLRMPSWNAVTEVGQFTADYLHPAQNAV